MAIECMHNQYLCNRQISVQYAYKKDSRGERHGGQVRLHEELVILLNCGGFVCGSIARLGLLECGFVGLLCWCSNLAWLKCAVQLKIYKV